MKKIISLIFICAVLIFALLLLTNPNICVNGAINGILLCGRVIIPSLFPFTFCVLFILKSSILERFNFLRLNTKMLSVFLLSLIGGYPLGAKILNESGIDAQNSSYMLNYCVNAGPAFIILAVGNGVFGSQKIGFLLFAAHIIPAFILAFLFRKKVKTTSKEIKSNKLNIVDNFVDSATQSAQTLINICCFVILFSVINAYINTFKIQFSFLKPFSMILEVTNAISQTRNILIISALLGFGGICVWCQVFALCKQFKVNYLIFILCRIFHGLSSALFTFWFIKFLNITVPTFSNGQSFIFSASFDSIAVGISLVSMAIVLMISLSSKNFTGNLIEDIV